MPTLSKTLIILATATTPSQLEIDIKGQYEAPLLRLRGVPKALLSVSGRPALSWWYDHAKTIFKDVFIVCNAHNYKHYERWATGHACPVENILNVGFSSGALSDIAFVHRVKSLTTDISITMPEFLYEPEECVYAVDRMISQQGDYSIYSTSQPIAFGFALETIQGLEVEAENHDQQHQALNEELESYMGNSQRAFRVEAETAFEFMSPTLTLSAYQTSWMSYLDKYLDEDGVENHQTQPIHTKAYARVGLMGNPSDGFYGKTISLLISNFWAETTLIPNRRNEPEYSSIHILPSSAADPQRFSTLESLALICQSDGYENGERLLLACCKVFYTYCRNNNIPIDTRQGFSVMFDTNVARQVGLAGSSAIITSFWKALMKFYHVTHDHISMECQASLILSVETDELGITAGLQDRVIQTYGGLVYMDFGKQYMKAHGHGKYERLDEKLLPELWLAYVAKPEDSGKVHSTVKQRYLAKDPEVLEAMKTFASFTVEARQSLEQGDHRRFAQLMTANFELRRKIYGDKVIGATNLRMIEIAGQHRCVAKFSGSGGAVVGMWNGEDKDTRAQDLCSLRRALEREGFVYVKLEPLTTHSA
ncbi:hypothetical protein EC973_007304 [Apophysomyces ossiformis]|uniref:GHMP kinase N-terminal domain-containing protein n=1 Tax=Apophysomyces ossiformis TaxID=679940 RepID=A0A8H7EQI4_9FUNG|nr:hypothetical protein EC973_007304 [Apophysomyces ossiformis]